MEKQIITEKDGVHKEWYKETDEQTLETLPGFLNHLVNDYGHDYGTICHAMAAGSIATIKAMDKSPTGGITGFQASLIMWQFIRNFNFSFNKCGLRMLDFDNFLYPQYEDRFAKVIDKDVWENIQKEALEKLKSDSQSAHPDVIKHWESIVDGVIPFGFSIKYS